jgi:hypothetical protein
MRERWLLTSKILNARTELSRFTGSIQAKTVLLCMGLFSTFFVEARPPVERQTAFIPPGGEGTKAAKL